MTRKISIALFYLALSMVTHHCFSQSSNDAVIKQQKVLFDQFFELSPADKAESSLKTDLAMQIMKTGVASPYSTYAYLWSQMLIRRKNLSDTLEEKMEAFTNKNPDFAQGWFLYGEFLSYRENNDCLEKLQKCIELNSSLVIPYFFLAEFYSSHNNPKLSLVYYDMLEKVKPDHKSLYYNRAIEKGKLKDYAGAIEDYGKVKPGTDNYPKALFNRGRVYMTQEDYTKAEPDFDNFLKIMPEYASGYYYRGYCRYFTKGKEASCADMTIALGKGYESAKEFIEKYCK